MRYYGCPAEEGGAAKGFMVRAGAFKDVDVAISWHPAAFSGVNEAVSLANTRIDFTFHGRASHAAAAPHLGRSALDAVELMSVGVNYMREHMPSDARIHSAILDAGGIAPNVVQARAKVRYLIRATDLPGLQKLIERVKKIAEGAALMTETRVEQQVISGVSNLLGNTPMEKAMHDNLMRLGPPPFDDADREFAAKIQGTLSDEDIEVRVSPCGDAGEEERPAVRCDHPAGGAGRADGRVDRCGRRELGGADGAGARRNLCDRHAGPFLAADGAGQDADAAHKGMVHVAKVMAGHGDRCDPGRDAGGAREGGLGGAYEGDAICLAAARGDRSADRHVQGGVGAYRDVPDIASGTSRLLRAHRM